MSQTKASNTTNNTNDGSIKLELFKNLMKSLQASSQASMDPAVLPVLGLVRDELLDMKVDLESMEDATKKLCIKEFKNDEFSWYEDGVSRTGTRKDSKKEEAKDKTLLVDTNALEKTTGAVINWLVKTLSVCVEKVNSHSIFMDAILLHHEKAVTKLREENAKVEEMCGKMVEKNDEVVKEINQLKEDKQKVETKVEELEVEKDEIRQRGMKGNLIISTNTRGGRASGFQRLPPSGPDLQVEEELDMVLRVTNDHSGTYFQRKEVQAFHANGPDRKNPTSYTLRIWDRTPGSNWEILKTGMRNWRKPDGTTEFDRNININVNFQLTRPRARLGKLVRLTRAQLFKEKILKPKEVVMRYSHDDNGVLRVKTKEGRAKWEVVTSSQQFIHLIKDSYNYTIPAQIIDNINSQ